MTFRFERRHRSDLFPGTLGHMVTADPLTFEPLTTEEEITMSNDSGQTYRFAAGLGDDSHLKEINALCEQGYRVAHMVSVSSGAPNSKPVVVLMELTNAPDSRDYSR